MATTAKSRANQNYDNDEYEGEEFDLTPGQKASLVLKLAGWHLRRFVVFVPIFGVIFLAIVFMWVQSVREEAGLNKEAQNLSELLSQPAPQPEVMLLQVDGWDKAYQVVLDSRVARPQDSDLIGRVIDAAMDAGLIMMESGTTLDSEATINNEQYTATPVILSAIGTVDGIQTYLEMLETEEFAAFSIQESTIQESVAGYQLTLRGLYYSLPEDFGESDVAEPVVIEATPIISVQNGGAK